MSDRRYEQPGLSLPPSDVAGGAVTCLGMEFADEEARQAYFTERLRKHLQDPAFRAIEGFPIGDDEAILALSDPPYYTACPNPFLPEIMADWQQQRAALHAELGLDDETYHREPFAADVSEGKNDPIYNAHSYHTKVPHKAIMRYILHYTEPGDIVFDGFCGSGMTGVAAQLCGDRKVVQELGYRVDNDGTIYDGEQRISRLGARKAVLNDLSPAATFIAYNYNTPVDVATFEREAKRILDEAEEELGWMYKTWHPNANDADRTQAEMKESVWSDVFVCGNCGSEIVFWDAAVDHADGHVKKTFRCPSCSAVQSKRDLDRVHVLIQSAANDQLLTIAKQENVKIAYEFGKHRIQKAPDAWDRATIEKISQMQIPYWFPTIRIDKDIDLWYERDYRSLGVFSVDAFFTKRNIWWLSCLWTKTAELLDSRLRNAIKYVLTGMQVNLSRMNRYRPNVSFPYNPLSGTLYLGALQSEANVGIGVRNKVGRLTRLWESYLLTSRKEVGLTTQSLTTGLWSLDDDSVDYIFVDPPFGSNIIYSDLSVVWESWLNLFTNATCEAVIHRRKRLNAVRLDGYRQRMIAALETVYRVLKPGRWATIEFHNTQSAVWVAIQEAIAVSGLIVADVRILDKETGSFKQVTAYGAVKQDLIISAYKPSVRFEQIFALSAGTEDGVWEFVREHLAQLPRVVKAGPRLEIITERQSYLLFDRVVAYFVRQGLVMPFGASQFYAGLKRRFVERDGMFYLPEQVAEYDRARLEADEVFSIAIFVNDEKSAIAWLHVRLEEQPQSFSEIQPRFLQELHQARHEDLPDLRVLLEQNFLLDNEGRYYVPDPANAEDLEKLRLRSLLQEFATYRESRKKLKTFRTEAVRAGFAQAYADNDFAVILQVAALLPESVIQEDPDLLMYVDAASLRE